MADTDDKIAAAVERLSVESCLHAHHALAAVFVAAARHREAVAVCREASRGDDEQAYRDACVELDASARELDAALQRAAEKVLA